MDDLIGLEEAEMPRGAERANLKQRQTLFCVHSWDDFIVTEEGEDGGRRRRKDLGFIDTKQEEEGEEEDTQGRMSEGDTGDGGGGKKDGRRKSGQEVSSRGQERLD